MSDQEDRSANWGCALVFVTLILAIAAYQIVALIEKGACK